MSIKTRVAVRVQTPEEKKAKARLRRILISAGVLFLVAGITLRYLMLAQTLAQFRQYCHAIKKGDRVADLKNQAEENGLIFETDFDTRSFADEGFFLIRPSSDWPRAFACRFKARYGMVELDF